MNPSQKSTFFKDDEDFSSFNQHVPVLIYRDTFPYFHPSVNFILSEIQQELKNVLVAARVVSDFSEKRKCISTLKRKKVCSLIKKCLDLR